MTTSPEERRLAQLPERAHPIRASAKHDAFHVHQDLDLAEAVELLAERIAGLHEVFLFGSRRFQTGSARSDVDLLLVGDGLPAASVVAGVAREIDSYLDVFVVHGGVAQSAVNESVIASADFASLRRMLDALPLWRRDCGWIADTPVSVRVLAGFNPPLTLAAVAGPEPLVGRADLLFVTALAKEHAAIVTELDRLIPKPPGSSAHYELGEIDTEHTTRRVAACVADRGGTVPAALTAFRGIEMFRPSFVVLVGITAGVIGQLDLGDLIVPDTVVEYEATKIGPDGDARHGRQHAIHPSTIAAVQGWARRDEWLQEVSGLRPDSGLSRLSTDAMASGNKVVASADRAAIIASASRKTAAIEMESLGVVEACQRAEPLVSALVVKAVSDLADENKDDSWHPFATVAAARLAVALARDHVV